MEDSPYKIYPGKPGEVITFRTKEEKDKYMCDAHIRRTQGDIMDNNAETEFWKAFHKVQGAIDPIKADATNPHFHSKYASFQAVMEAVRPFMEAGFTFNHAGDWKDGRPFLTTHMQRNGYTITSVLPLVDDGNPQHLASSMTYAKRNNVIALTSLPLDVDDDGNAATEEKPKFKTAAEVFGKKEGNQDAPAALDEVTTLIDDVEFKQGEGPKGNYTKWTVKVKGMYLSTFDETAGHLLHAAMEKKLMARILFTKSGKYFNIKKVTLPTTEKDPVSEDVGF